MPFAKAIFNKNKRFHWYRDESDLVTSLSKNDLKQTWFIADLFYPEFPDYNSNIHRQEISLFLSKPDELVMFEISEGVKRKVLELEELIGETK
ncbi:hypothetical protein [Endozoicomonas sp. ALD040]|uniref:hypothetical protein n=1 Tax=Endozoicomonas sp. ALD040 TaxID=3403079 RepID=UPI003BB0930B